MKVLMIPDIKHPYMLKLGEELNREGIEVSYIKSFHYSTPMNIIKTIYLRLRGYDIIHIHWMFVFPFIFMMKFYVKFAHLLGYKVVWSIHDILPHDQHTEKSKKKAVWFYNNVDYKFIHYRSNVKVLKETLGVEEKDLKVIYHPSLEESYPNEVSKEEARKELGIPMDSKVSLCFGHMRGYKGVDIFLDAMKLLGDDHHGLIVGKPQDKELYRRIESESSGMSNVTVVPRMVDASEVQTYLNACDVLVAPYRHITTSGVTLLAYSFSRPVISTSLGCIPEVIKNGRTGLIVEENIPESIAAAIRKIFTMDHEKMGKDAYALSKKFSWEGLCKKTIEGYKEITT